MREIPIIDIRPFIERDQPRMKTSAQQLHDACRNHGFFYLENHGIDTNLQSNLELLSRDFFALPESEKMKIRLELGGSALRGYFPVGGELTSGKPDLKEGIYFGTEDDYNGDSEMAMHGQNQWPTEVPELKTVVLDYMGAMKKLGDHVMQAVAMALGLDIDYFESGICKNPFLLFRAFHYPPSKSNEQWGVGDHTDYGLLTILKQDTVGGLQVLSDNQWIDAPYIQNTFICNIGDMLDRMTQGYFQSTRHRVKNTTDQNRITFPFFYDPDFGSEPSIIPKFKKREDGNSERWDNLDVYSFHGKYGDYITKKVAKVFPNLIE